MPGRLVHEWIEPHGGAEKVLSVLVETFPDAKLTCLWNDGDLVHPSRVEETWLARSPLRGRKAAALPFMLPTWRNLPAAEADWILCSSHLFAHHAMFEGPARGAPKFVYAHTPARYIWTPDLDRRGDSSLARLASMPLKVMDRRRAAEAQAIAANSAFVANRIEDTWEREATVIYPPVDVAAVRSAEEGMLSAEESRQLATLPEQFVLGASRFVTYKEVHRAIEIGETTDMPVVLAGNGPLWESISSRASEARVPVTILRSPSDNFLRCLYSRASLFVFPPVEDFGIMPVEAMAAGTPVLVNALGGASESVVDGITGVHVHDFDDATAVREAATRALGLAGLDCAARAESFDTSVFVARITEFVGA